MAGSDRRFWGDAAALAPQRGEVEDEMVTYMHRMVEQGGAWSHVARHMMGLWSGTPGARHWRQVCSDHRLKAEPPGLVRQLAHAPAAAEAQA